ncbi:uncharacterized protein LOC122848457 [Aphidius gifuensis]|nr:uncharacterized protein LOC122848457 [Aphidius gifuensis]
MANYSMTVQRAVEIDINNTKKSYENENNNVESKQLICYNSFENKITTIHEECQSTIKICTQKNFNKYHHCKNTNFPDKRQTRSVEISIIEEKLFNKTGWNKKIIEFVNFCADVSQSQTNCLTKAVANFNEKINLAKNILNDCIKTLSHWNPPYADIPH